MEYQNTKGESLLQIKGGRFWLIGADIAKNPLPIELDQAAADEWLADAGFPSPNKPLDLPALSAAYPLKGGGFLIAEPSGAWRYQLADGAHCELDAQSAVVLIDGDEAVFDHVVRTNEAGEQLRAMGRGRFVLMSDGEAVPLQTNVATRWLFNAGYPVPAVQVY